MYIPVKSDDNTKLLCKVDPSRLFVEIQHKGVKTIIDLAAQEIRYYHPGSKAAYRREDLAVLHSEQLVESGNK